MAECAGLFLAGSEWLRDGDPRADTMLYLAGVWSTAAVEQAEAEGRQPAIPYAARFEQAKYE